MKVTATVSLNVQRKYGISNPLTMYRASDIVRGEEIQTLPSGNLRVESQTRPNLFHLVNPQYESCNCEAGKNNTLCIHLIAYLLRRAQLCYDELHFQEARKTAIATNQKRVAVIQESRPRGEWIEELDL